MQINQGNVDENPDNIQREFEIILGIISKV